MCTRPVYPSNPENADTKAVSRSLDDMAVVEGDGERVLDKHLPSGPSRFSMAPEVYGVPINSLLERPFGHMPSGLCVVSRPLLGINTKASS